MKINWRRYAPAGLYLSLIAALAAGALYIIQKSFSLYMQIALGLVVIGLAVTILLDPDRARRALTGRQARYGSNALVMAVAFIGILVIINYLVIKFPQRVDMTEDKQHSLAPETIQILKDLSQPVTAEAFYTSTYPTTDVRGLLESYKYNSNGKFDYQFIDPQANPVAAQNAKITRDGTIVLKIDDRQEMVSYPTEQELSGGLVRLSNPGSRAVYFLTGHGEADPTATDETSYSQAQQTLTSKNYTVKTLNLLAGEQIPKDALSIIIAGPKKPLTNQEVGQLKGFSEKGGALVVMTEPPLLTGISSQNDPLDAYLQSDWGIKQSNDLVFDPNVNPSVVAISGSYGDHQITQNYGKLQGLATVFPTARSIQLLTAPEGVKQTTLIASTTQAWGETSADELQNNQVKQDDKDFTGPMPLAVVAENNTTKGRVIVVGDSEFGANQYFTSYGNSDFLINSIDWASQQENLINLTPKSTTQRYLMTPTQTTLGLVFLVSVFLLPLLVIISGISVWLQRKHRG